MVVVANGSLWRSMTLRSSAGSAIRIADEPRTAIGRLALAMSSPARARSAVGRGREPRRRRRACNCFVGGRERHVFWQVEMHRPLGSVIASAVRLRDVSATLPGSSGSVALVIGLKSAWWSIHIWMRRPSWSVLRLQVMAIIGERSRNAQPTPVARLVAPGPGRDAKPGRPVIRPVTSAAKPAEPSCAVSTNSTSPFRIASISGSTLPLGIPNPRLIPAAFSVATIRSALFMR